MKDKDENYKNRIIRVLFVCHGNICRSPMAEFVLKDMAAKRGLEDSFIIMSAATSTEEIGNPVHSGTRNKLKEHGIGVEGKTAVQVTREDYEKYDYIIGMEERNISNMKRIMGADTDGKAARLLDYTDCPGDIADPWYTGDFSLTYREVCKGCQAFMEFCANKLGLCD